MRRIGNTVTGKDTAPRGVTGPVPVPSAQPLRSWPPGCILRATSRAFNVTDRAGCCRDAYGSLFSLELAPIIVRHLQGQASREAQE